MNPQDAWPFDKPVERWNIHVTVEHGRERFDGDLHQVAPYKSKEEAERDINALYEDTVFDGLILWSGSKEYRTRRRLGKKLIESSVLAFHPVFER